MTKLPIAVCLSAIVILTGCSSSGSSPTGTGSPAASASSSPSPTAAPQATDAASKVAATAVIKKNWATFFNSATPHSAAAALLQNGSTLGPAIKLATKIANAEKTKESAVVTKVTFTDATDANILYNLLGNGKPLLSNSNGAAVYQDGTWKVKDTTFCTLVELGAGTIGVKKVPGCQ